jgi:hypothetical protein
MIMTFYLSSASCFSSYFWTDLLSKLTFHPKSLHTVATLWNLFSRMLCVLLLTLMITVSSITKFNCIEDKALACVTFLNIMKTQIFAICDNTSTFFINVHYFLHMPFQSL